VKVVVVGVDATTKDPLKADVAPTTATTCPGTSPCGADVVTVAAFDEIAALVIEIPLVVYVNALV
jgi:predicted Abi (CAAX) family protease